MFDTNIPSESFVPLSNLTVHGPIYLAKEDNVKSEQTFRIVVQVADSVPPGNININPATIGRDYSIGLGEITSSVIDFLPSMQRVNFPFELFPDNLPERIEAFRASSSAEDKAEVNRIVFDLPNYLSPTTLVAETFVLIEDDDRKDLAMWNMSL